MLSFCCESCAAEAEKGAAEGVCDFMAVVNGCQDAEAITAMHSDEINRVCDNACSLSIMNNWEPCLADAASGFGQFASSSHNLEPIVNGCRRWRSEQRHLRCWGVGSCLGRPLKVHSTFASLSPSATL